MVRMVECLFVVAECGSHIKRRFKDTWVSEFAPSHAQGPSLMYVTDGGVQDWVPVRSLRIPNEEELSKLDMWILNGGTPKSSI